MKTLFLFILFSASFWWAEAVHWTTLKFSKGDVLSCDENIYRFHFLLATNDSHVAHIENKSKGKGRLVEEGWSSYHRREDDEQTNCRKGRKAIQPDLAVEKARQDIRSFQDKEIYYNKFTCNCEHWVSKWAKGAPFSIQSRQIASSRCDVHKNPVTDSDFARYGGRPMTTNGGRCPTQCIQKDDGKYYCGRVHCSPRRDTTYRGHSCHGKCRVYWDYFYCYTDRDGNWDYCGPTY